MAYRRSLTTLSARLVARQRFAPSFAYTHQEEDLNNSRSDEQVFKSFVQSRSFVNNTNTNSNWLGFGRGTGMSFGDPKRSQFLHVTSGFLLDRNMSTVSDKTMEVVSSEVAIAAADSWPPVAFVQHAIDGIHTYTGLNWWASIVITTLVIRTLALPFMIRASKSFNLVQKAWEESHCKADFDERADSLFKEHGITVLTGIIADYIKVTFFVSFYFAIQNMVEKVPSFQTGGISWFLDLTTADSYCILPYLAAFSFWVQASLLIMSFCFGKKWIAMKEDLPGFDTFPDDINIYCMRHLLSRIVSGFTLLFAAPFLFATIFPNALLCYCITNSSFSIVYRLIIQTPSVKKLLNIPEIEPPPPRLRFEEALEALKKYMQLERQMKRRHKALLSQLEEDKLKRQRERERERRKKALLSQSEEDTHGSS